jgi:hypothetical protein
VFPSPPIVTNWYVFGSPDYFSSTYSYTYTYRGLPTNDFGNSYAKHGIAYAGLGVYLNNPTLDAQEYIYQQLTSPLKQDSTYCLSFFVSYSDRAKIAIKNLGAFFSVTTPSLTATGYLNTIPQITNTLGFLTDTINWVEINGCFTAQGGENYVTIGNFNSHVNTDTLHTLTLNPFPTGGIDISYYYIDSISLWQNNFPTAIKENSKDDVVSVYPNPTEGSLTLTLSVGEGIEPKQCVVKIIDVLGREALVCDYKEQLNISQLEKGIYFLSLYEDKKLLGTKKIIKQ